VGGSETAEAVQAEEAVKSGVLTKFFSVSEVAEALQVHPGTVKNWIYEGKLLAVKAGKQLRVSEEAVEIFLAYSGTPGGQREDNP
jgi:excisionase family DNA binding protein